MRRTPENQSRRKEIIKIKAEINAIENRKTIFKKSRKRKSYKDP